jgi:hypothetical protein
MARFVPKYAHTFRIGSTLYFQHLLALKLHQARVGQIKRNRDPGHSVGRKPFLAEPNMRLEPDPSRIKLLVKPPDLRLEKRPLDFDRQVRDSQIEQLLVG